MKLIYKPFGILLGLFAGFLSKKIFDQLWGLIDDREPPKATTKYATWPKVLAAAAVDGVLTGSHDLSDGGLAQALVEACLIGGRGAAVTLPRADPFVALFAESAGRVLVTVDPADAEAFAARATAAGVPVERLGGAGGATLRIADVGELDLAELRAAWEGTLPALFDA